MKKNFLNYKNGFPANISFDHKIVVQIVKEPMQSVVLYTCKINNKQTRCFLGYGMSRLFEEGIYTF